MLGQSKNQQQGVLDKIIGDPPLIERPSEYSPDCLYQAFISAVSVFEQDNLPADFLRTALSTLQSRVAISRQTHAANCLDAFNEHYARRIDSLDISKTPKTGKKRERKLDKLIIDATNAISHFTSNPSERSRSKAMQSYDAMIGFVIEQDTDEAHDRLEKFQEDNEQPIQLLLNKSTKNASRDLGCH